MNTPPIRLSDALGHDVTDKRLDILRRIGLAGSISEAARGAGVSYKAAWQAIDTLSNLAGTALLQRSVGGTGGGGAQLTPAGQQLLATAALVGHARAQVLAQLSNGDLNTSLAMPHMAALGLRTSMRNQMPCTVTTLKRHEQAVRVQLSVPGGHTLFARITRASAELLGLEADLSVLVLCKATAIEVSRNAIALSGRNRLQGRATRVSRAAAGGEVALELEGGLQLVGFAGPASGITARSTCYAHMDESALVIALGN